MESAEACGTTRLSRPPMGLIQAAMGEHRGGSPHGRCRVLLMGHWSPLMVPQSAVRVFTGDFLHNAEAAGLQSFVVKRWCPQKRL